MRYDSLLTYLRPSSRSVANVRSRRETAARERNRKRAFRPQLEALEDRCLLSAFARSAGGASTAGLSGGGR